MLRNSLQGAFCGLIFFCVTACTSTKPLFSAGGVEGTYNNVRIKADPFVQYRFSDVLNHTLPHYVPNLMKYIITINITESSLPAMYTSEQVAKDQMRIVAYIEVYDKEYTNIGSKTLDSLTTYEVGDDLPHTINLTRNQARISAINDLANASALAIREIVTK